MRAVIQRVSKANVKVNKHVIGEIKNGLLILLGFVAEDEDEDIEWVMDKIVNMRIFSDHEGKMNLSVLDVSGELLLVSQFTLIASTKKGNRPSFMRSAPPNQALELYNRTIDYSNSKYKLSVQTGEFGAMMDVSLINDGPVTIIIDSKNKE